MPLLNYYNDCVTDMEMQINAAGVKTDDPDRDAINANTVVVSEVFMSVLNDVATRAFVSAVPGLQAAINSFRFIV